MRFPKTLTSLVLSTGTLFACTENADIARDKSMSATGGAGQPSTSSTTSGDPGAGGASTSNPGNSSRSGVGGASQSGFGGASQHHLGGSASTQVGGTSAVTQVGAGASSVPAFAQAQSSTPAITTPEISDTEYATFIADANAFGLGLTQAVETSNGLTQKNSVFSPTSAQIALAMTYAGAKTQTATAMASTLHDGLGSVKYHAGCNRLLRDLESRNFQGKVTGSTQPLRIELAPANSLWVERTLSLRSTYLDTLKQNYDTGLYQADFVGQAEPARLAINQWVEDRTQERIQDLLSPGDLTAATQIVLVNALYLYANWQELFEESMTDKAAFHTLAGPDVETSMMHGLRHLAYADNESFEVVRLPYVTGNLWMTLVLPKSGQFETVRAALGSTLQSLDSALSGVATRAVRLSLPKFQVKTDQLDLVPPLSQLGMTIAFGGSADFSGIADADLYISKVVQKAFIGVDEKGTEAAAATAVVMDGAAIVEPTVLTFDRPFLFFIQDATGLVLFAGHVVDPTQ